MTEEKKREPEDSTSAASKMSQVSSKKKAKLPKSSMGWIIGGFIVLILLSMLFSGGHKKKSTQATENSSISEAAQMQLQRNVARLKEHNKVAVPNIPRFPFPVPRRHIMTRKYLARQNAPTSMYSGTAPNRNSGIGGNIKEATLADRTGNAAFANKRSATTETSAYKIPHPSYTIASGEFIHAELETAIDSDLPGMVRAVITRPVYAYVGESPLIPAGSRLIGQYSSAVMQGQDRVMIVWNRIILPSGIAINVDSPGADELGRAGQGADSINRHFFLRFGEASLLSLLGAGMAAYNVNTSDQANSASDYRMAIAMSFQQSAQKALEKSLPIKPTLHIYQGANINVFVAHDMSFYNVLSAKNG